jgi:hypothetical protein
VVVVELARFGGEAEVGDGRRLVVCDFEAGRPFVLGLVLQVEFEGLVGEVGEAGFGGELGVADAAGLKVLAISFTSRVLWKKGTYRATGKLVCLAVVVLVVCSLPVTIHSHDVGKHCAGAVVLVCIEEDTEALELVGRTEDVALGGALLGEPHCEAVAIQVALAANLELYLNLGRVSWKARC